MDSILDILETMKERVTQAASDTLGSTERAAIESELDALAAEIDDIVDETTFNGNGLLGSVSKTIQTGEATSNTLVVTVTSQDHKASSLTVGDSNITITSSSFASAALGNINTAPHHREKQYRHHSVQARHGFLPKRRRFPTLLPTRKHRAAESRTRISRKNSLSR